MFVSLNTDSEPLRAAAVNAFVNIGKVVVGTLQVVTSGAVAAINYGVHLSGISPADMYADLLQRMDGLVMRMVDDSRLPSVRSDAQQAVKDRGLEGEVLELRDIEVVENSNTLTSMSI